MRAFIATILTTFSMGAASEVPPAYVSIANNAGIPPSVLWTIAIMESNAKLNIGWYPWPWTLNVAGKSIYLPNRDEACQKAVESIEEKGPKSVDIGLTQNNWGYNGIKYFNNPCDAFDPVRNLQVASIILRECYEKRGDWIEAAGCYHRRADGKPAEQYKNKFAEKWDDR